MKRAITVVGGLFLASSFALAGGDKHMDKSFKDLDANNDGAISKAEASASKTLMANFDKADINRDGKIESREYLRVEREIEEAE